MSPVSLLIMLENYAKDIFFFRIAKVNTSAFEGTVWWGLSFKNKHEGGSKLLNAT